MNEIYIGGDSFCFERRNPDRMNHSWPVILASKLNLKLNGTGFAGRGFWRTRLDLINYLKNNRKNNVDLFILCHTNPDRLISSEYASLLVSGESTVCYGYNGQYDKILVPHNNKEISEMYYKYMYESEIHNWAMKQWFAELNVILKDKNVIHLFCFDKTAILERREPLNGHKMKISNHLMKNNLHDLAVNIGIERGHDPNDLNLINHFPKDINLDIANMLMNYYLNEIIPNPGITKYFDFDI